MSTRQFIPRMLSAAGGVFLLFATASAGAATLDQRRPEVREFIAEMSRQHGFDDAYLREIFSQVETQQAILDAIARPAERTKPWHEYRGIFLTDERIERGVKFWHTHKSTVDGIAASSGIPAEVIVAILGVETYYGTITGNYRVIDALSTLAFEYPPRSAFFRAELEQFLLLTREESVEPLAATGSYAGAMGAPQFISSSYRAYAVDSSGDGRRDLWSNWSDVLGSVANYFRAHGWRRGEPVAAPASLNEPAAVQLMSGSFDRRATVGALRKQGVRFQVELPGDAEAQLIALDGHEGKEYWVGFRNFRVITRYNNSVMYALAVLQLGEQIAARAGSESIPPSPPVSHRTPQN